ncbi:hypothetical protein V8C44DRAFT_209232 [Trichoderma aethiopicum]
MLGGHDVSRLMRSPYWSDEKDEYLKEEEPTRLLPLPFPSAMDGHPVASKSPLFTLPPEILGEVMNLLMDDRATLSAMALVNSDCRQLARSCQFDEVCFDYGPRSNQLRSHLMKEASARQNPDTPDTTIRPPFIGSCIRRVTVRSDRDYVANEHSDLHDSRGVTSQKRAALRKEATEYYFGTHYASLLAALSVMPNIESLLWYDKMCLDVNFFKCVTNLPLRHLKICNAYIGNPYCFKRLGPSIMSLESLYLDISVCYDKIHADDELFDDDELSDDDGLSDDAELSDDDELSGDPEISDDAELCEEEEICEEEELCEDDDFYEESKHLLPFMKALLQRCSATLQRLTIRCSDSSRYEWLSFGRQPVDFGQLQYLNLSGCFDDLDPKAWSSLLSAPLRHLALPGRVSNSLIQSINVCKPLSHLQTLVLPSFGYRGESQAPPIIELVTRHPHVRKLSVQSGEPQLMDAHLVPLLSNGRWSNLTSLSLAWRGSDTPEENPSNIASISAESLAAIGRIMSLEQLHLTAGEIYGNRHQWLIDHKVVRSSLRGLAKLKRLAFSRDTYSKIGISFGTVENYYDYRWTSPELEEIAMERPYLDRRRKTVNKYDGPTEDDELFYSLKLGETRLWECAHRNRMLREAERYLRVLPSLEWICCGQRPMGFRNVQTSEGKRRIAMPLTRERDTCSTFLRRMFTMGEDDGDDDDDMDYI